MTAQVYPLQWPEGWPRTKGYERRRSPYRVDIDKAVRDLHSTLKQLGALEGSVVVSSNVPPRNRLGVPKNDGMQVSDPGVAVYWTTRAHGERVIACDKWNSVLGNVRAIGLALRGLHAMDRAGASQIMDRAFSAFGALPPGHVPASKPWWDVLGFGEKALDVLSVEVIDARWRELSRKAHPDRGGSHEAMSELNEARRQARRHYGADNPTE